MKSEPTRGSGTAKSAPPILQVRDVSLAFGGIAALSDVSFSVRRGSICGLIGPNGAGKTSIFNCISRLYRPDKGSILFLGTELMTTRPDRVSDLGVTRTFQHVAVLPDLTVAENVMLGAYHLTRGGMVRTVVASRGVDREEYRVHQDATAVLEDLGLADIADHAAQGLPYGTLKRVELARALMAKPKLLILDEPANGLTHQEVDELGSLIRQIAQSRDLTVLLVEHAMALVMRVCDDIVVMDSGRTIAHGAPAAIQQDPIVIKAYLGDSL